jgi:hypothetical protein
MKGFSHLKSLDVQDFRDLCLVLQQHCRTNSSPYTLGHTAATLKSTYGTNQRFQ